jgi:hypothetical protein
MPDLRAQGARSLPLPAHRRRGKSDPECAQNPANAHHRRRYRDPRADEAAIVTAARTDLGTMKVDERHHWIRRALAPRESRIGILILAAAARLRRQRRGPADLLRKASVTAGSRSGDARGRPRCVPGVSWRPWQAVTATRRPGL